MQFGKDRFENEDQCVPVTLDGDSLMRGDEIILYTKNEIRTVCAECNSQEKCIDMLKELQADLFNNFRTHGNRK